MSTITQSGITAMFAYLALGAILGAVIGVLVDALIVKLAHRKP